MGSSRIAPGKIRSDRAVDGAAEARTRRSRSSEACDAQSRREGIETASRGRWAARESRREKSDLIAQSTVQRRLEPGGPVHQRLVMLSRGEKVLKRRVVVDGQLENRAGKNQI